MKHRHSLTKTRLVVAAALTTVLVASLNSAAEAHSTGGCEAPTREVRVGWVLNPAILTYEDEVPTEVYVNIDRSNQVATLRLIAFENGEVTYAGCVNP